MKELEKMQKYRHLHDDSLLTAIFVICQLAIS